MFRSRDQEIRHVFIATIVIALVLRLLNLGGKSLWLDEAYNLAAVSSSIEASWPRAVWPPVFETHHPPLYYLLLRGWVPFGYSELSLRLLPALFGTLSVPLLFALSKQLVNRETGVTAAALAAVSPLMIWYSQEARSYSFATFLGVCAMLAAVRLFQAPGAWRSAVFAAALTAALYTHYVSVLLIPLQLMLLIGLMAGQAAPRSAARYWLAGAAIAGLAFSPWLITPAARQFFDAARTGSYPGRLAASMLGTTPEQVMRFTSIAALLGGLVALALVSRIAKRRLVLRPPENGRIDAILFVAVIVIGLVSVVPRGYSLKKQLLFFWPYWMVLVGWWWPWSAAHRRKIVASCGALLVFALVNIFAVPKDDWRSAAAYVAAASRPGDVVVLVPGYSVYPFEYYNRGRIPVARDTRVPSTARVWLVGNREESVDPDRVVRRRLGERANWIGAQQFFRVRVDLFEPSQ